LQGSATRDGPRPCTAQPHTQRSWEPRFPGVWGSVPAAASSRSRGAPRSSPRQKVRGFPGCGKKQELAACDSGRAHPDTATLPGAAPRASRACRIRALNLPSPTPFPADRVPPGTQLPRKGCFWGRQAASQGHPSPARAKAAAHSAAGAPQTTFLRLASHQCGHSAAPVPPVAAPSPASLLLHPLLGVSLQPIAAAWQGGVGSPRGCHPHRGARDGRASMEHPYCRRPCLGRGLDWVTHRGPFQPRPFCDSVIPACAPTQGAAAGGSQTTADCCPRQGLCCSHPALGAGRCPSRVPAAMGSTRKVVLVSLPRCCLLLVLLEQRAWQEEVSPITSPHPTSPISLPALPQAEPPHPCTPPSPAANTAQGCSYRSTCKPSPPLLRAAN